MQILAIEKEIRAIDPIQHRALLRDEAARVWHLKKASVIRDIWFTIRGRHAVVMLECADENEAMRQLASLPLVQAGLITFDVHALGAYDGLDRLINAD